jgi:CRP/FNR family transcriptional regulator, cyclic AMP receptor protein
MTHGDLNKVCSDGPAGQDEIISVVAGLTERVAHLTLQVRRLVALADARRKRSASPNGAERILAILGSGSIVGDMAMIDGRPRSASVRALRDCQLSFVSRSVFDAAVAKQPDIYKYLLILLAERLRKTDQLVAAASFLPLKGRVARAFLDLAKAFGRDVGQGRVVIQQKISQSDIVDIAGIARENVSRILSKWMRLKLVTRSSGYYCLEKVAKLEKEIDL